MPAEPLSVDAALAEFCLHMGDALVAADRVERSLFGRRLLTPSEEHALRALRPDFARANWHILAPAMSMAATTVASAAERF